MSFKLLYLCTPITFIFLMIIIMSYGRFMKLYQSSLTLGSDAILTLSAMFLKYSRSRALEGIK